MGAEMAPFFKLCFFVILYFSEGRKMCSLRTLEYLALVPIFLATASRAQEEQEDTRSALRYHALNAAASVAALLFLRHSLQGAYFFLGQRLRLRNQNFRLFVSRKQTIK